MPRLMLASDAGEIVDSADVEIEDLIQAEVSPAMAYALLSELNVRLLTEGGPTPEQEEHERLERLAAMLGVAYDEGAPEDAELERLLKRDDFLASVIVTAVEGGIGYWASTSEYRWFSPDLDGGTAQPTERGGASAFARLMDREGDGAFHDLTPAVIERAFETIAKGPVAYLSTSQSKRLLGALDDLEGGDIDSDDADVLVQIGLLGGVVYG